MNRALFLAGRYFSVYTFKLFLLFASPFSRVSYDRKNDWLQVDL